MHKQNTQTLQQIVFRAGIEPTTRSTEASVLIEPLYHNVCCQHVHILMSLQKACMNSVISSKIQKKICLKIALHHLSIQCRMAHSWALFWDNLAVTIPKPLQPAFYAQRPMHLCQNQHCDNQATLKGIKLDEDSENEFNCLESRNEMNQKRIVEQENIVSTSLHIKQDTEQSKANRHKGTFAGIPLTLEAEVSIDFTSQLII